MPTSIVTCNNGWKSAPMYYHDAWRFAHTLMKLGNVNVRIVTEVVAA